MSRNRLPLEGKLSAKQTDEVETPASASADRERQSALSVSAYALPPLPRGEATHIPGKALLCTTSPSLLRNATSPSRGGSGVAESPASSPLRCEETSLPKAPLLGELASKASLRGCTKDGPGRRPQLAPPLGATTTTAACGRNREELLGPRPARRECRPRHEADAGCRNPELLNEVKLRGRCRWRKSHRCSDKLPSQKMIFAVAARAALMRSAGAQQTCVPMRPPET